MIQWYYDIRIILVGLDRYLGFGFLGPSGFCMSLEASIDPNLLVMKLLDLQQLQPLLYSPKTFG